MEQQKQIRPRDEAVEQIECYIRQHKLAPQGKLPAEREMCEMWDLNRTTLRSAIKRLTSEGKLYSLKGSGTYVAPPKLERRLQDVKSTTESVRGAGHLLRNLVLDVQVIEYNKYLSKKLEVPLGHKVFYLRRLRIMDGSPYAIGQESVGITYATEDEARHLEVKEGDYLFYLSGVTRDAEDRLIEYCKSVVRADKVRFSTVLRRYEHQE